MIVIGTQGWNYKAWVGPFYPRGTRSADFLGLYSRMFDSVEVDSTFYAPPTEQAIAAWLDRTPENFSFALKLPRRMTHENRLRDSKQDLDTFVRSVRPLGARLACILIQLPPDLPPTEQSALARFLAMLPANLRFAVEFRDPGWITTETTNLLGDHGVSLALVDGEWLPRDLVWAWADAISTDFAYVRFMGSRAVVDHSKIQIERPEEMEQWSRVLVELGARLPLVLTYFSNFYQGHAPESANRMRRLVGQTPNDPNCLVTQPSLF